MLTPIEQTVADFFSAYPLRRRKVGQTLFWPGEPIPGIAYCQTGTVGQYYITADGQKLLLNAYKPHSFFPMWSVLNSTENEYFFDAIEPLSYRLAPQADVLGFIQAHPEVTLDLLARVYRGTDGLLRRQAVLMAGTAQHRLLLEIVLSAYRFGTATTPNGYTLRIKTIELAERTGLSRETVSRQLKQLTAQNLVHFGRGSITIADMAALEHALHEI